MARLLSEPVLAMPAGVTEAIRQAADCNGTRVVRFDGEPLDDLLLEWISRQDAAARCRFERGEQGELIIMAVGKGGGERIVGILLTLINIWIWGDEPNRGEANGSNKGYEIPGLHGMRSPDVSWISSAKLAALPSEHEQEGFTDACPEFVVEVRSNSQSPRNQLDRIEKWIEWGASVAWMIDPFDHAVHVARPSIETIRHDRPDRLEVGPEMPGFSVDFARIWRD